MAPQVEGYGQAADIWSFGITMLEVRFAGFYSFSNLLPEVQRLPSLAHPVYWNFSIPSDAEPRRSSRSPAHHLHTHLPRPSQQARHTWFKLTVNLRCLIWQVATGKAPTAHRPRGGDSDQRAVDLARILSFDKNLHTSFMSAGGDRQGAHGAAKR